MPRLASADWLLTPFIGVKLDGETSLIDLERGAGKRSMIVGGSVMILGNGPLGVEGDFGYLPGFLGSKTFFVASSRAMTLTGNVVIAAPVQITRESLRPFVVAGVGWMNARLLGAAALSASKLDELALDVGGGAIGTLTRRTSVRFEIRRFQNLTEHDATGGSIGRTRLRFWRADVGLALRY